MLLKKERKKAGLKLKNTGLALIANTFAPVVFSI